MDAEGRTSTDVRFWVANVLAVNDTQSSWECDYWVILDWSDERLRGKDLERCSCSSMWHPQIEVKNAIGAVTKLAEFFVEASDSTRDEFRVRMLTRYTNRLYQNMNMRSFPLDVQELTIQVEDLTGCCQLTCNATDYKTFIRTELSAAHEWNPEWIFSEDPTIRLETFAYRIVAEHDPPEFDRITLGIIAVRRSQCYQQKFGLVLGIVILFNTLTYYLHASQLKDKYSSVLTLFLIGVAFQQLSASGLPKLGYMTVLDKCCMCVYGFLIFTLACAVCSKIAYDEIGESDWDSTLYEQISVSIGLVCSTATALVCASLWNTAKQLGQNELAKYRQIQPKGVTGRHLTAGVHPEEGPPVSISGYPKTVY